MAHHGWKSLMLACMILFFMAGTVQADELPKIVVGCDTYPPYNYLSTEGVPTGIDVDLAVEAFRRMGYQAEFRFIDWTQKKQLLADGSIDCVWCSFSKDGREKEYRWAGPYMVSHQVVAVKMDSGITKLSQLEGKRVAVQSTTKPEELFLNRPQPQIPHVKRLISLQNRMLIYSFLSKGYVDAIAAHENSIRQYMEDYNVEYRILDEPLATVGLGVAFDLNDTRGLEAKLNDVLKQMRQDGTTANIVENYLPGASQNVEVERYGY